MIISEYKLSGKHNSFLIRRNSETKLNQINLRTNAYQKLFNRLSARYKKRKSMKRRIQNITKKNITFNSLSLQCWFSVFSWKGKIHTTSTNTYANINQKCVCKYLTRFELSSNVKIVQSHFLYIEYTEIIINWWMEKKFKNEIIVCKRIFLETQSTFALDSLKIEKKKKKWKMQIKKKDEQTCTIFE